MALRMSQMLRSSRDLRGGRSRASVRVAPSPPVSRPDPDEPMMAAVAEVPEATPVADVQELTDADGAAVAYEGLAEAADELFESADSGRAPNGPVVVAAVRAAVDQLGVSDALLTETVRRRPEADSLSRHSVNIALMAMRLGREVEFDERRTLALGLCGLTHDLGMLAQGTRGGPRVTTSDVEPAAAPAAASAGLGAYRARLRQSLRMGRQGRRAGPRAAGRQRLPECSEG